MNSLYKLLEETVLLEGRKEQVMAKYPDVDKETIEFISQNDPSGNNKYLDWSVKQVNEGGDKEDVIYLVNKYHQNLSQINADVIEYFVKNYDTSISDKLKKSAKDIAIFPNLDELRLFTNFLDEQASKTRVEKEIKAEGDKVFENKDLTVVSPRTHRASCKYGMHSAWCVATSNTSHFANYTKDGTLYFFISRKDHPYTQYWKDKDGGEPPYKTALLLKDNGQASWWSKGDTNYVSGLDTTDPMLSPFFTERVKNAVLAHNRDAIKNRKQRQIEDTLRAKGFYKPGYSDGGLKENFGGFVQSGIYSIEQLISIIKNDNWLALFENSTTGKNLRQQLGNETVFNLIVEMLGSMGKEYVIKTLKDMESQDFFRSAVSNLSDEENREIAKTITQRLGAKPTSKDVGNDVKIYVDKWTLSPEGWRIYNTTSNYFVVGDIVGDTIKPIQLIKIDRFNPADHSQLQVSSWVAKNSNSKMYAVTTEKDLLDDYVGKGVELPPAIQKLVSQKASQVWPRISK
jgi:hypothetical protein